MSDDIETLQKTRTQSRIKAWYLTTFRKKRVFSIRCNPQFTIIGVVIYSRCWVLING
jgi:hypothetical protein